MAGLGDVVAAAVVGGLLLAVALSVRAKRVVVFEHERVVTYRYGRLDRVLGPGRTWLRPGTAVGRRFDLRPRLAAVTGQEVLSADGIALKVSLYATWAVTDPVVAATAAEDPDKALHAALQLALRGSIGRRGVDDLLAHRDELGAELLAHAAPAAAVLGLRLDAVDLKDLTVPPELRRVMAQVVTARKEGQAALERARGEAAALRSLANLARLLDDNPALLQLRTAQLVAEGGGTLVLGAPPPPGRAAGNAVPPA